MWDTVKKLEYRSAAGISGAEKELSDRLNDRYRLPLQGIHGESLYLTGMERLRERAAELNTLYAALPAGRGQTQSILLDAFSSATIEGARTTVAQVRQSFEHPATRDDRMVVNSVKASRYAYGTPITRKNIRELWDMVVEGVCENQALAGTLYRSEMVYVGSSARVVHIPAPPERLPELMEELFEFLDERALPSLVRGFAAHFYFVYVHPFCDGNGRTARILNASGLYHWGYEKMKGLALSRAINDQLSGYYGSLADSETVLQGPEPWLDLSPFVTYMMDAFERCMMDAVLYGTELTPEESRLLERMNRAGANPEISPRKAARVLGCGEPEAAQVLNSLSQKGYLNGEEAGIYRMPKYLL